MISYCRLQQLPTSYNPVLVSDLSTAAAINSPQKLTGSKMKTGCYFMHCSCNLRYWKTMRQTMNTVFQLFSRILSLVAILGIFLFVFTILGLRLYAGRYNVSVLLGQLLKMTSVIYLCCDSWWLYILVSFVWESWVSGYVLCVNILAIWLTYSIYTSISGWV